MKKKINDIKDIKKIIDLYQNGLSCTKISKLYNTTSHTVIKILRENNIFVYNKQNQINFNEKDILDDYLINKLSIIKIIKKWKTSYRTIKNIFDKKNIEIINNQNKTKFNENIFDSIDTEEKAYWLGFIFADGYISSTDNTFELSLSIKDIDHLKKFNIFMQHEHNNVKIGNVRLDDKEFKRCRWSVCNKHLWNVLNNYGCTPQKSLTLKFPDINIFKEKWLIIPFIRGYFDGDGSVSITSNVLQISILGTKDFIENIQKYFFNSKISCPSKNDKTFVYSLSNKKAYYFLYTIYYKSNIFLNRKFNKFIYYKNCRSKVKAFELLSSKFGEGWDANSELTYCPKKQ